MPTGILSGRIAAVTGGGSGIGAACALSLARAGADVAPLIHEDGDKAKAVAAEIVAAGHRAVSLVLDVGVEEEVEDAFDRLRDTLGLADILVNSAGLNMTSTPVADMGADQWKTLLRTNLTGSFLTSRRFVRDLRAKRRPGTIVNITSIHAFAMRSGGADYAAAKGGQANLTRTMALECAPLGITVNAIAPGMIMTPMNADAFDPEKRAERERAIPAGRAGTPEEVGRLAMFLASPDASYITGATVVIDRGLSLLMGQGTRARRSGSRSSRSGSTLGSPTIGINQSCADAHLSRDAGLPPAIGRRGARRTAR